MEAKATAKHVRMGPRKVRFVLDTIRGKYATDALDSLKFIPNFAADEIANVLKSAIANARENHGMDTEFLKVARCYVDVGPTAKRVQPRAQGRAYRILKRSSHITIVVQEGQAPPETRQRELDIKKRGKKPPLQAPLPGAAVLAEAPVPVQTVEERDAVQADETLTTAAPVDTAPVASTVAEENAMGSDETTPLPGNSATGQDVISADIEAAAAASGAGTNKE